LQSFGQEKQICFSCNIIYISVTPVSLQILTTLGYTFTC